jgi:glutathione S-transferase
MAQITLYGPREAPFVLKVELALALKKLEFTTQVPRGPEDYRRWSPETGLLPVIDVDGTRVHDSSAILDYLDERFPEPPLLSGDPKVASSQRRLESWTEETFVFYWMSYLRALVRADEATEGDASNSPRIGPRSRFTLRRKTPTLNFEEGLGKEFSQRLDDLVNFLGRRPFFYSDRVSRADLAVYAFLLNMPAVAGPVVAAAVESRQALVDLMARVEAAVGS